jgi:hypothetical protein
LRTYPVGQDASANPREEIKTEAEKIAANIIVGSVFGQPGQCARVPSTWSTKMGKFELRLNAHKLLEQPFATVAMR